MGLGGVLEGVFLFSVCTAQDGQGLFLDMEILFG